MARSKRSTKLDSRGARLALPAEERHLDPLQPGQYVIYQRPKSKAAGSWLARSYDPETRKQRQIKLGIADDYADANGKDVLTFAQAQAKAREWFDSCGEEAARALAGEQVPKGPYTVALALADYLEDAKRRGMKSMERTQCAARAHILPELGAVEVAKLTRGRIEAWLSKLAESPKRVRTKDPNAPIPKPRNFKVPRKPKAASAPPKPPATDEEKRARKDSANRVLTVLKAALNHALDRGRVKHGEAWQAVKPYRGTTSARVRFLTPEEQVRLVNACPSDFRRLVIAALHTGARYGELGRLQMKDFNPEAGTLWIAPGKTDKGRHVVLTEEGRAFFSGITAGGESDALMFQRNVKRRSRKGMDNPQRWARSDQNRLMDIACKAAGLESLTFHELRHTYASGLVNAGCPLAFVAELLGHSDIRMVSKHYGHLAPNALADAVRTLAPKLGLGDAPKVALLKIVGSAK